MKKLLLAGLLFSQTIFADFTGVKMFAPDNDLDQKDIISREYNIKESDFDEVLDIIEEVYSPIIKAKGANLVIQRNWSDSTVNAYASREGNNWILAFFGGLARRPEITKAGFALVVCHELGHHLGGYPYYPGNWASSEGQSDIYATADCARRVINWLNPVSNLDPTAKKWCEYKYAPGKGVEICMRFMHASQSTANLLAVISNMRKPSVGTPSKTIVSRTQYSHPAPQCRLDTYVAGIMCDGMKCVRPRCWFAK